MSHRQNAPAAAQAAAGAAAPSTTPVIAAKPALPQARTPAQLAVRANVGTPAARGFIISKLLRKKKTAHRAAGSAAAATTAPGILNSTVSNGVQGFTPPAAAAVAAAAGAGWDLSTSPGVAAGTAAVATNGGSLGLGAAVPRAPAVVRGAAEASRGRGGQLFSVTQNREALVGSTRSPIAREVSAETLSTERVAAAAAAAAAMVGGEAWAATVRRPAAQPGSHFPGGVSNEPASIALPVVPGGGGRKNSDLAVVGQHHAFHQMVVPTSSSASVPVASAAATATAAATNIPFHVGVAPATAAAAGEERPISANPAATAVVAAHIGGSSLRAMLARSDNGNPGVRSWNGSSVSASTPANNGEIVGGGVEPWDEDDANGGAAQAGGGGQGRAASGGGGGGEVDAWATSPSRVLGVGGGEVVGYEVVEKAAPSGDTVVLLLEQAEGVPTSLVGVEFSTFRLSLSFDRVDDAMLMVASLLYLQALKYRVLSTTPPYTRGYVRAVPAPFVASLGPFDEAGLEHADLVHVINGGRFDDGRWWEHASSARPGAGAGAGAGGGGVGACSSQQQGGVNSDGGGGGGPAMAPPGRGGGKKPSGGLQLPFVELEFFRATGETSHTTTHPGSAAARKAWVDLRLLQQQQTMVAAKILPTFATESSMSQENLERKRQALAKSLEGDAAELSVRLHRSLTSARGDGALPPTAVATKIKESVARYLQAQERERPQQGGAEGKLSNRSLRSPRNAVSANFAGNAVPRPQPGGAFRASAAGSSLPSGPLVPAIAAPPATVAVAAAPGVGVGVGVGVGAAATPGRDTTAKVASTIGPGRLTTASPALTVAAAVQRSPRAPTPVTVASGNVVVSAATTTNAGAAAGTGAGAATVHGTGARVLPTAVPVAVAAAVQSSPPIPAPAAATAGSGSGARAGAGIGARAAAAAASSVALVPAVRSSGREDDLAGVADVPVGAGGTAKANPGFRGGWDGPKVGGLCSPRCLDELLACLVEYTAEDGRPILYLNDDTRTAAVSVGGGTVSMQDEWDEREMANRRRARRRGAVEQAEAEVRLWGCETDATGQTLVGGQIRDTAAVSDGTPTAAAGGAGAAAVVAAAGPAAAGPAVEAQETAGETKIDEHEAFVPFEPPYDEDWQVAETLPAGHKMVRQLMHVNGIEADELTLAELEVSMLSDASSLAQEMDTAVSYAICHVAILMDETEAAEAAVTAVAAAQAAAAQAAAAQAAAAQAAAAQAVAAQAAAAQAAATQAAAAQAVAKQEVVEAVPPPPQPPAPPAEDAAATSSTKPVTPTANDPTAVVAQAAAELAVRVSAAHVVEVERTSELPVVAAPALSVSAASAAAPPAANTVFDEASQASPVDSGDDRSSDPAPDRLTGEGRAGAVATAPVPTEAASGAAASGGGGSAGSRDSPGDSSVSTALLQRNQSRDQRNRMAEEARIAEVQAEALRRRNDPVVKARRKANAEAAAKGRVKEPCRGMVVWAECAGELWPSLILESLPKTRCVVRFLATPEQLENCTKSPPVVVYEEVEASSLVKFPGGLSLMALKERLAPLGAEADKEAIDEHIRNEFLLPANEDRKRLQLAIDHAVRLCILYLWEGSTETVNVVNGEAYAKLQGMIKKKRGVERKRRIDSFLRRPDQWISPADTKGSYARFRILHNDRQHSLCEQLQVADKEIRAWIDGLSSGEGSSSTPAAPRAADAPPSPPPSPPPSSAETAAPSRHGDRSARDRGTDTTASGEGATMLPANDARRPEDKAVSPRSQPTGRSSPTTGDDGGGGRPDEDDSLGDDPQDGSGAAPGGIKSSEGKEEPPKESKELAESLGASASASAVEVARAQADSGDDTKSDEAGTDKGKGKPKRGRNEAAFGGGDGSAAVSAVSAVGNRNEADGSAADAGSPPEFKLKKEKEDLPYSTAEMIDRLNVLWNGWDLDHDHFDKYLGQLATDRIEKARGEDAGTTERGNARKETDDNEGSSGAGLNRNANYKAPGESRRDAKSSAGTAKDEKGERASESTSSTPMPTAKTPSRKRRLQASDEEENEASFSDGDATVDPNRSGDAPSGAHRNGPAGAHDSAAGREPPQQHAAKRPKTSGTSASASAVIGNDFRSDGSCGGEDAADFSCGGSDDAGNYDWGDGGSDFDDDSVPSPPPRLPSSRREGASKPILERAKAKSILGKGKATIAKLRDKIPIGAAGSSGASYLIPKKAVLSDGLSTATTGGGGSSGKMTTSIPKKTIPKLKTSCPVSESDPEGAQKPPPAAAVVTGRSSKDSRPPGGGNMRVQSNNESRDCEGSCDTRAPKARKLEVLILEGKARAQESIEDECRQKLGMGGAYLGTQSRSRFSEKLMNAAEQGFRFRRKKLNAIKALANWKAKHSNGDGSDDGGDEPGDEPPGAGAGERARGAGAGDGRGRFGILVNGGDSELRIRPPTPPLPARGQPKISPISPRADARPIGECKSSWGGDHRGGRGRGEGKVSDARVPPRGRDSTGNGRVSTGGNKGVGTTHSSGGAGTKVRPPPPRVGSVSQQPRGESGSSPAKQQSRAGNGGGEECQGRSRDYPHARPRASSGTGVGGSRSIDGRDSRDSFRSDEIRAPGGRAEGGRGGAVLDHPSRREGNDTKKKLARKSEVGRPESSDNDRRARSHTERGRDRLDGMGGAWKRSPSSSVDREDRGQRKLKLRQKNKSNKKTAMRAASNVDKRRPAMGESTKSSKSLKRMRSSSRDGADGHHGGLNASSRPVHGREDAVPRAATADPVDDTLLGVSAIASPSNHLTRNSPDLPKAAANGGRAPLLRQPNVTWTAPAGQPPPPQGPPPPQTPPSTPPSARPRLALPQVLDHPNTTQIADQPPLPLGPPPPLDSPPRSPSPPCATSNPNRKRKTNRKKLRRSGPDDDIDMDIDDGSNPSPIPRPNFAAGQRGATGAGVVGSPPLQTLPLQQTAPSAGPQRLPLPPLPPPPQPPQPRRHGSAPPTFIPPPYARAGDATAAATAPVRPVVTTTASELRLVHAGVVGRPPLSSGPAPVTLPLRPAARAATAGVAGPILLPPQQLGAAVAAPAGLAAATGCAGPPLFSPQQLDAAVAASTRAIPTGPAVTSDPASTAGPAATVSPADPPAFTPQQLEATVAARQPQQLDAAVAIHQAAATLRARRGKPPAPPTPPAPAFREKHQPHRPDRRPFRNGASRSRDRHESNDRQRSRDRHGSQDRHGSRDRHGSIDRHRSHDRAGNPRRHRQPQNNGLPHFHGSRRPGSSSMYPSGVGGNGFSGREGNGSDAGPHAKRPRSSGY